MKRLLLSTLLVLASGAPVRALPAEASAQRQMLAASLDSFLQQVQSRVPRLDARGKAEVGARLKRVAVLRQSLQLCADRPAAEAWGGDFFAEAEALIAPKVMDGLGGTLRLAESYHRGFVSALVAAGLTEGQVKTAPVAKLGAGLSARGDADDAAALDRIFVRYSGGTTAAGAVLAGGGAYPNAKRAPALPAVRPPDSGRVLAPRSGTAQPAKRQPVNSVQGALQATLQAPAPSPANWAEALVRAWFQPDKKTAPLDIEYRFADDGEITGVRIPSQDYEESREFEDGLVRSNLIRRGAEYTRVRFLYDAKGRLTRRLAVRYGPGGTLGTAEVTYDPSTRMPVRGQEKDPWDHVTRLRFDKQGRPLNSFVLVPLPGMAPVAELVLDWQISREDRLKIQEDTRPKVFHSPFWDGRWSGVSRGYTDPDLPKTWKRHPILKVKMPHEGIDLPVAEGTKVYASRRGKVLAAGWENGYGLRVTLQHYEDNRPDGAPHEVTLYGHLSKVLVRRGQWVTPGKDVLGLVGSTGLSTGPHLHFEVREGGKAVDPISKLSATLPARTPRTIVAPLYVSKAK